MAKKIGTEFARDMLDRGRRELGAAIVTDSNIAQPMYPLHGARDAEQGHGSIFDGRVGEKEPPNVEPARDKGMDRE
jgi:hypothetical protein